MSAWPIWILIVILTIAAFVLIGAGRITTGPRMHNRYDRYDPVYLQRQEALQSEQASPHKE